MEESTSMWVPRQRVSSPPSPSWRRCLLIVSLLIVSATIRNAALGQAITTQGNCSPALETSTVDGSIVINCTIDAPDLTAIAQGLNTLKSENKLTAREMEGLLKVTNL